MMKRCVTSSCIMLGQVLIYGKFRPPKLVGLTGFSLIGTAFTGLSFLA